jgi:HK97 gp10 family phage protein
MLRTRLTPLCKVAIMDSGKLVLDKIVEHIDNQDLGWKPKAKNPGQPLYMETGTLKRDLQVTKLGETDNGISIFIGPPPNGIHEPSRLPYKELMVYLEFGTSKAPARPLIRPTWNEMKPIIEKYIKQYLRDKLK